MRKILIGIALSLLSLFFTIHDAQANAGCYVITETDDPTDPSSLSGIFNLVLDHNASNCSTDYKDYTEGNDNDVSLDPAYTGFDQEVNFLTAEFFGGTVKKIQIANTIDVNLTRNLILGNFSLDALLDETNDMAELTEVGAVSDAFLTSNCTGEDSEGNEIYLCEAGGPLGGEPFGIMNASQGFVFHGYTKTFIHRKFYGIPGVVGWNKDADPEQFRGHSGDKGYVLIDIRDLDGALFNCENGSAPLYLTNIAIVGNSANNGDFVTKIRNHTDEYSCIRSAGDLHLCDTAEGTYLDGVDPNDGTQEWCEDLCREEDRINFYADKDNDGFGTDASVVSACEAPSPGYVEIGGDCDGTSASINPNAIETCGDGIDQDCNGFDLACPIDTESCTDGLDNDGDGLVDCADIDCVFDISCQDTEVDCTNGADDDGDGALDCFDSDCVTDAACTALVETQCSDGTDNDGDASVDCEDTDCSGNLFCMGETECSDDTDNDSDGLADCSDADCASSPSCVETECEDGLDNDGDSSIDCSDPDCAGVCGVDMDLDGFTVDDGDCDDSDASVYPNADLKCEASAGSADGIDANCNGILDHEEDACLLGNTDISTSGNGDLTGSRAIDCSCNLSAKKAPLTQQMSLVLLFLAPLFVTMRLRRSARQKSL